MSYPSCKYNSVLPRVACAPKETFPEELLVINSFKEGNDRVIFRAFSHNSPLLVFQPRENEKITFKVGMKVTCKANIRSTYNNMLLCRQGNPLVSDKDTVYSTR